MSDRDFINLYNYKTTKKKTFGSVKRTPFMISVVILVIMEILVGGSDDLVAGFMRMVACFVFTYCVYCGLKEEFMINPYSVFSITPLSLLLYSEKISTYYLQKLSNSTWLLAIMNIVAFIFAFNCTNNKWKFKMGNWRPRKNKIVYRPEELNYNRIVLHSLLLCVMGELPLIASLVGITIPFRSVIGFFLYIGIVFAFKSRKKWLIAVSLMFSMFNFIEDFNKTRLLYLLLTIMCCAEAYYIREKKDRVKFFAGIAIFGAFMLIVAFPLKSYMRGGGNILSFFLNSAEISASIFSNYNSRINFAGPLVLRMPYMYLVSAWNNVQYVMQTQPERTYGLWMLKPLLGYLQLDGRFESLYQLTPYSSFNTYTYITVLFKDFGYFGSIFGSLFLGFYVKKVYAGMKKEGSAFDIATYSLVAMATLEMFFSNHFYSLSYPFTILIISFLYKKMFRLNGY